MAPIPPNALRDTPTRPSSSESEVRSPRAADGGWARAVVGKECVLTAGMAGGFRPGSLSRHQIGGLDRLHEVSSEARHYEAQPG